MNFFLNPKGNEDRTTVLLSISQQNGRQLDFSDDDHMASPGLDVTE